MNLDLSTLGTVTLDAPSLRPAPNGPASPFLVPHPTEPNSYILRVDNSTLTKFQTCPRASEYYNLFRRTSNTSPALVFGGAIHQGLEVLYRNGFTEESLLIAKQRCAQHFVDNPVIMDWRTDAHALTCIDKYYDTFKHDDSISIFQYDGAPFVERSFEVQVGHIDIEDYFPYEPKLLLGHYYDEIKHCGPSLLISRLHIHWIGKIDAVVHHYGKLMVMDHKTTTMLGDTFFADFDLGQQPIGYTWACQQILGYRPDGFLVNPLALRKPTPTGKSFEFPPRKPYYYTDAQLTEWHQNTMTLVSDFVSHTLRGFFPMSTVWCVGKYGMCPYHQVCTLPTSQRPIMLSTSNFSNVTWDPTT
jgi:hypothetical protein